MDWIEKQGFHLLVWLLLPTEDGWAPSRRWEIKNARDFLPRSAVFPKHQPGLCTAASRQGNLAVNQDAATRVVVIQGGAEKRETGLVQFMKYDLQNKKDPWDTLNIESIITDGSHSCHLIRGEAGDLPFNWLSRGSKTILLPPQVLQIISLNSHWLIGFESLFQQH